MLVNMWLLILERIHFGTSHSHSSNTPSPVNVRLETSQPMKFEEVRIVQIWLERWEQVEVQSSIKCFAFFAPINFDFIKRFTDGYVIRNKYIYIYIYRNKQTIKHTYLITLSHQARTNIWLWYEYDFYQYSMSADYTKKMATLTQEKTYFDS